MKIWNVIQKLLRFDTEYDEFELLEVENGTPPTAFHRPASPKRRPTPPGEATIGSQSHIDPKQKLSTSLEKNLSIMKKAFSAEENKDCIFRRFRVGSSMDACAVYLTGMADTSLINEFVLRQSMAELSLPTGKTTADYMLENVIAIADVKKLDVFCDLIAEVLNGSTALFFEGEAMGLAVETPGFDRRSVQEASIEKIIRGPQEAFTENLRTNVTLVRRIVRTTDLRCEFRPLGGENNLRCALVYRQGITNESLLKEVRKRLSSLRMHYMVGEGMLQQLIEERKFAPIAQVLSTERPDRVAALLMQGHVAVICDGSPFVCVLPVTIGNLVNTPEDIYLRPIFGTLSRIIRYAGILMSILLPALYVSLIMYHPELLPIEVINTILESRRMVSLPIYLEIIFMLFLFQLVRESGLRVPGAMGQAVGIIGGLIMGQASVDANLVSSMALIIVALTGLGTYTIPVYSMQYTAILFRLIFILSAALAGLPGMAIAIVISLAYLCSLKSFGVPMMAPFAPKTYQANHFFIRSLLDSSSGESDLTNTEQEERR